MQLQGTEGLMFAILGLVGLCLIVVFLFLVFQRKKNVLLAMQIESRKQFEQELLSTKIEIQTQTMQHIGREIHDNIGQKLTLASLYAQQLIYENKVPMVSQSVENISDIINSSLSELRELSKSLTDDKITTQSISNLIGAECQAINEIKSCVFYYDNDTDETPLSYQTKSVLLRISQEFLQNSIKHAQSNKIEVFLICKNNLLQLLLQDDGKGFNVNSATQNGIGLANMKKRAGMIGGTFSLKSERNLGTKLIIEIPL